MTGADIFASLVPSPPKTSSSPGLAGMPHGPRGMVPNNVLRFTTGVKKARADWVGPNMPKIATHNFRSRHNKAWILCSWSVSRRGLSSSKPAWEEEEEDLKKPAFSGPRADQHRWSVGRSSGQNGLTGHPEQESKRVESLP